MATQTQLTNLVCFSRAKRPSRASFTWPFCGEGHDTLTAVQVWGWAWASWYMQEYYVTKSLFNPSSVVKTCGQVAPHTCWEFNKKQQLDSWHFYSRVYPYWNMVISVVPTKWPCFIFTKILCKHLPWNNLGLFASLVPSSSRRKIKKLKGRAWYRFTRDVSL